MPSIKQIIAEVQLAGDLGPNQKQFTVKAIRDAEARISLKSAGKPRRITNAKGLKTLTQWEDDRGQLLCMLDLKDWCVDQGLYQPVVCEMMVEFREIMGAKGKQYANFVLAFQNYLRRAWLSKSMDACRIENHKPISATVIHTRGGAM